MASIDVLVKEKLPPLEVPQKECPEASPAEEGPLAPGRRQGPELSPATMSRTVSWSVRRRPNAEGRRSNEGCHFCPPVCCVRLLGRKITRPAGPERLCPRSPRDSDVQRQVRLLCWFRALKIIYLFYLWAPIEMRLLHFAARAMTLKTVMGIKRREGSVASNEVRLIN